MNPTEALRSASDCRASVRLVVAGLALAGLPALVLAHHGIANFDLNTDIALEGTIRRVEFLNPHSWLHLGVEDEDGDDHVIELVDFLIPCKEGQKLSLFIVKSGGNLRGPYFRAYNHNTREHYENTKAVSSEMFPMRKLIMATGGVGVLFFLGGLFGDGGGFGNGLLSALIAMVVGGILFGVAGKIVAMIRGSNVRKNPEFAQFLAGLASG